MAFNLGLISLALCLATTAATQRVSLETFSWRGRNAPKGWTRMGRVAPNDTIPIVVAVKMQRTAELEEIFWAVSTPPDDLRDTSTRYAKYLTRDQINDITRPKPADVAAVLKWLASVKIYTVEPSLAGDLIFATMPAASAEALLETRFYRFVPEHPLARAQTIYRAEEGRYTVPQELGSAIDFVGGVGHFSNPRVPAVAKDKDGQPLKAFHHEKGSRIEGLLGVTPSTVRYAYNASNAPGGRSKANRQAIASFIGQYYDEFDLQEFYAAFVPSMVGSTPSKVVGVQGLLPGIEANLDVQYITAVAEGVDTWVYSNSGAHSGQEPFLTWLNVVNTEPDSTVPHVLSVSYGDNEYSVTAPYASRLNVEVMKVGLRGISLLFASGDSGTDCMENGNQFAPDFPVDLPTLTAVGGTLQGSPETANSISGGGFSNYFTRPDYQSAAVQRYLTSSKDLPPAHYYNSTGRGYPDVAALSNAFWVMYFGIPNPVAGTSCAAPSFSAIIALVNDARLAAGKPYLGFLNPLLYKNPAVLNDVVSGCNQGCDGNNGIGFCAAPGWDPVTGLGSPNYGLMTTML